MVLTRLFCSCRLIILHILYGVVVARSLNGGERAPPKPIKPLRYRIDPTAEKLDALDKLEAELDWQNRTQGLDPELYFELLAKLQADRAAIIKKRDKGKPIEDEKDYDAMPYHRSPPVYKAAWYRLRDGFNQHHFTWILGIIILLWMLRK